MGGVELGWIKRHKVWSTVIGLTTAIMVIGAVAGGSEEAGDTAKPESTSPPPRVRSTSPPPTINTQGTQRVSLGEVAHVGDLDLLVKSVEAIATTRYNRFNKANLAVALEATNARGREDRTYTFSMLTMKLVDENGVAHSPEFVCADCPNEITSVDLVRGGTIAGVVYFRIEPDADGWIRFRELRYEGLLSTNKAIISLR